VYLWQQYDPGWQDSPFAQVADDPYFGVLQHTTFAVGMALTALILFRLAVVLIRDAISTSKITYTSNDVAEARTKRAGTQKINSMLVNAYILHRGNSLGLDLSDLRRAKDSPKRIDKAMDNYVQRGESYSNAGGFLWTWKRILNGSLFYEEGVWIHSRLVWVQAGKVLVGVIAAWALYWSIHALAHRVDVMHKELNLTVFVPQWYINLIPTSYMIRVSLYPAWAVSIVVIFMLVLIDIPR